MLLRISPPVTAQLLTTVYHSIIRGNRGRGIVNAKRSNINERKTTLSTLIAIAKFVGVVSVDQRNDFRL